jgi:glyoxylase I family protein
MTDTTAPPLGGIHHLALSVTDLDRSVAWYADVLGLERGFEIPDTESRGQKSILRIPGARIALTLHQANEGEPFSEFRTGLDHFALSVADRDGLEAWQARLGALGVAHSPITQGATGWFISVRDPDGIQLEIYTAG